MANQEYRPARVMVKDDKHCGFSCIFLRKDRVGFTCELFGSALAFDDDFIYRIGKCMHSTVPRKEDATQNISG